VELLAALAAALVAAFVRGASGFGFSLLAAPILALFWAPELATPVVLLLDVLVTVTLLHGPVFRHVRWGEALFVCGLGLAGSVVGTVLAIGMALGHAEIGLHLAVLASAVAALLDLRARFLDHAAIGAAVSFVSGALIGAFAVGGPLLLAWLLAVRRSPGEIRGTLTLMFGLADMAGLLIRLALGAFPLESLKLTGILAPAVMLGVFVGGRAFHRVDAKAWRQCVSALLALVALVGLGHAGMALL
jgi:uncharacterized protein